MAFLTRSKIFTYNYLSKTTARPPVSSYTVLRRAVGYSFVTVRARSGTENEGAQRYTFCDGMTWMGVKVEMLNLEPGDRIELSTRTPLPKRFAQQSAVCESSGGSNGRRG